MEQNYLSPTFIIGVPRSGTSLLRVILDSHSQIAGAPETGWITGGYTDFSIRELVEELISNKIGATRNLAGVTPDIIKEGARKFICVIFKEYLVKRKKRYLVLKTPDDAAYLEFLLDLFPNSKYIHIFRDGRDVACSTIALKNKFFGETLSGFGELNLFNALKRWNEWEQNIRLCLQERDSISISYEQLVLDTPAVMQQVLSFLDIPFEERMVDYSLHSHEFPEWEAGSSDVKSMKDVVQSRIGRWKNEIPPDQWSEIDILYGPFFREIGYETCDEIKKEEISFLKDTPPKNPQDLVKLCEHEILTLKQSLNNKNLLLKKQEEEINLKITQTIPNLQSALKQQKKTIGYLQNILQNQDELLLRIVGGKSFKLGRFITNPARSMKNLPPEDKDIQALLQRKKCSVNLGDQLNAGFGNHRSGWAYAVASLAPINKPGGIYLDTFVERTFVWKPGEITPTLKPWIGFIHVPPNVPDWFQSEQSNDAIFATQAWQESLPHCKGLFTLSNYHKKSLEEKLDIPINSLLHPTEFPHNKWQFEKFVLNPKRKIVQIGWWLRKLHAIFELPPSNYEKVFVRVSNEAYFQKIFLQESLIRKKEGLFRNSMYETATIIEYLPNNQYDRLLSENIVFVDLYDSSANNLVIECIVRNTPLLVNPLEPVVEYLGEEYPFYFTTYEEAVEKAQDLDLVEKTYNYLKDLDIKQKLTGEYFLQSFSNSEILKNCQ